MAIKRGPYKATGQKLSIYCHYLHQKIYDWALQKSTDINLNIPRPLSTGTWNLWTDRISFYFDGAIWVHKTDPWKQARTPRTHMWRKKGGRVASEMLYQGQERRTCGRMVKFMVAISCDIGVIVCFWYEGNITEELFLQFVRHRLPHIFSKENSQKGKLFLQDVDPPRIVRCLRKLWIKFVTDYLWSPLGPLI